MSCKSKYGFALALGLSLSVAAYAQCPDRPNSGTVVADVGIHWRQPVNHKIFTVHGHIVVPIPP